MDIILELSTKTRTVSPHDSITGILRSKIVTERKSDFFPENYYFLTHLINPAQTFWSKKNPDIAKSNDMLRKLFLGRKLERTASFWFRKLPNFFTEGGKLDGAFVGIPRVRGKIDFRIDESIIEFKTKDTLPKSENEILEKYPQDLEQLAFYSVLDTLKSMENYLVFMNNVRPYKIKAFKVTTTDVGKLKTLLLERIKLLDEAFKNNDCSKLGQCRYYDRECRYNENNICKCGEREALSSNLLKESVIIKFDKELTGKLQEEMTNSDITRELFTTINIIAPRKYIMERKMEIESDYIPDQKKDSYTNCLQNLINKLYMRPSVPQQQKIKSMLKDNRVHVAQRWLNIPSSSAKFGKELLPYTVRVGYTYAEERASKPTTYALAELAIICSLYGRAKGLIFTIYPNLNDHIQVFEVNFRDPREILDIVKNRLDALDKAIGDGEILKLPACPDWFNTDGNCQLTKVCNEKPENGCNKY